jgi:hypothetical protein
MFKGQKFEKHERSWWTAWPLNTKALCSFKTAGDQRSGKK